MSQIFEVRGKFICEIVEARRGQNPQEIYTPIVDKDITIESMNGEVYIISVGAVQFKPGPGGRDPGIPVVPGSRPAPSMTLRPDVNTFVANLLKAAGATGSAGGGRGARKTRRRHK